MLYYYTTVVVIIVVIINGPADDILYRISLLVFGHSLTLKTHR